MKRKPGLIGVLYAAILAAIAGYFFRTAQLSGGSSVPVVAFSILMVLVFALAAVSLEKHAAYAEVYSPCRQDLAFSLLGAGGSWFVSTKRPPLGKAGPAEPGLMRAGEQWHIALQFPFLSSSSSHSYQTFSAARVP